MSLRGRSCFSPEATSCYEEIASSGRAPSSQRHGLLILCFTIHCPLTPRSLAGIVGNIFFGGKECRVWRTRKASADLSIFLSGVSIRRYRGYSTTRKLTPFRNGEPSSSSTLVFAKAHALTFPIVLLCLPPPYFLNAEIIPYKNTRHLAGVLENND